MSPSPIRLRWPLLVLMASIALTAFAAFDAQRTVRGQTRLANEALHEFATFAAWSYGEHLQQQLSGSAVEVIGAVNHGDNMHTSLRVPVASDLVHFLPYDGACDCHRTRIGPSPATFFAFKLGSKDVDVARNANANSDEGWRIDPMPDRMMNGMSSGMMSGETIYTSAERKWIADTLTVHARAVKRDDHGYGFMIGRQNGRSRALAFTLMPTAWGDTMVYGVEYTPTGLAHTFGKVLDGKGLLPASFTEGRRNRDVVALRVVDGEGNIVFNSSPGIESPASSKLRMPDSFGGMSVDVLMRPEQAKNLIIGGTPSSRFPFLLGLLALAAMLSVVAVAQIRKETELAGMRADFVSSISHELRTPLAQIKLYLETLQTGRAATPEKRAWSLNHIDRETTRLGNLVENVLRFSRLGRPDTTPEAPVDLQNEILRIVDEFRPLAASKKATIDLALLPDDDDRIGVLLRPEALRHVVVNLLDNAVKYGPVGQAIRVLVEKAGNSTAKISITDEGSGVPEADRKKIWSAFARAKTATGAAGSGIGLTIVHDVVSQNGGVVSVEASPNGGACFVVTLPAVVISKTMEEHASQLALHS